MRNPQPLEKAKPHPQKNHGKELSAKGYLKVLKTFLGSCVGPNQSTNPPFLHSRVAFERKP